MPKIISQELPNIEEEIVENDDSLLKYIVDNVESDDFDDISDENELESKQKPYFNVNVKEIIADDEDFKYKHCI